MRKSIGRRVGVSLAAVAVLAGVTSCQKGADKAEGEQGSARTPTQALTAAYKKTAAAKSAKVTMALSMPASMPGGGETKMSGVMGWDPMAMDMTMDQSPLGARAEGAEKTHMIWLDNVVYMDMGKRSEALDGKRWGKIDLRAAATLAGDDKLTKQLTAGLGDGNQDPAQQLAMVLGSPNVKHLGAGEVNGQHAEHYKGTLTADEALASLKTAEALPPAEREKLIANIKKAGVKGYDYDVWVNGQDYPVKMDVGVSTPQGRIDTTTTFSDYGAKAAVQAPPADDTVDLMQALKEFMGRGK
ncbi:hypothetical protein [Streptomyces sp. GS7]|uniref:hypothetical protein n=1 Tax=Streptomyces sp. GS7 TaxID=2692234 RepID=UPI0013199CCE|nr:hypothetical protein [Streptomyces sp. GS7]QHC23138.1 hypothetical protein GR130_18700 [Streptomyces sp. GS7]